MDFQPTETQQALADLVRTILDDRCTHERLSALEAEQRTVFDRELWAALADAGVTGAVVPEELGGSGLGPFDLLLALEECGRYVAPIPAVPTLVSGVLALRRWGGPEATDLLQGVAGGTVVLTAALEELTLRDDVDPPPTAHTVGDRWQLSGVAHRVPYGTEADAAVVAARSEDGPVLLWCELAGVERIPEVPTDRQPMADLAFDATPAGLLAVGADAVEWLWLHTATAWCAVQAGVCDAALRMTARYTSERQQFGHPIAAFQAVAQRAADAYIDTTMVRLTAYQAASQLAEGVDARAAVHTAAFWATEGAIRVVHAAQHLHGGIGVSLDYPLHRYFLRARQIAQTLGGPTRELLRLGGVLAAQASG